ncbi:MAG: flagellar hook-basal body complex protein, partial [Sporomusaceae bacterium]|nr:flagellar hook-basal body complex protein [Sporomusaceae bacterium]
MGRSMYSAVSGLLNMQTGIDVIGNNVANVNTIGYKGNTTNFQDILSQTVQAASAPAGNLGGTNPMQVGLGMTVASIGTNFKDGNLQSTGKQTDMALSGNGFFILQNGSDTVYTRVGSFTQDALGSYVSSGGLKLMGWMADATGTITSGASMQPIQVKLGTTMASKTTT